MGAEGGSRVGIAHHFRKGTGQVLLTSHAADNIHRIKLKAYDVSEVKPDADL
jgi:hypothetical protein